MNARPKHKTASKCRKKFCASCRPVSRGFFGTAGESLLLSEVERFGPDPDPSKQLSRKDAKAQRFQGHNTFKIDARSLPGVVGCHLKRHPALVLRGFAPLREVGLEGLRSGLIRILAFRLTATLDHG